ncbi:P-loop NTPase [Kineococcus sp. NUM-3379]
MSVPVLVAVPGGGEAALVSGWEACRRDVVVARRCADVAELLAAAGAGLGRAAVVGADLPGLDAEAVARLAADGLVVVALVPDGEEALERRTRQLGVPQVVPAATEPATVASLVVEAVLAERSARLGGPALSRPVAHTPVTHTHGTPPDPSPVVGDPASGRVVTVWGPAGSTGRTTIAVNVAAELAHAGERVLLVDADTYGASVALVLGVLDEAPSLLAAVRAATDGRWDVPALERTAAQVQPGLRILTGAVTPRRWHEVRPAGLHRVLDVARAAVDWIVVDVASCAEQDEEGLYDVPVLRRNAATLTALAAADVVVVVGAGDPVGLQRMVTGWQDLPALAPDAVPLAVANRVRSSAVGRAPERQVRAALQRFAGIEDPVLVPEDGAACDAALLVGRTLAEGAPRSAARRAVAQLAERVRAAPVRTAGRSHDGTSLAG